VEALKIAGGFLHGRMLDGADHHAVQRRVRSLPGQRHALDRKVVRLSATRGERHFARPAPQHVGHGLAGIGERRCGGSAQRVVAGRVAELAGEEGPHGLQHLTPHRRGGCCVKEDHGWLS
jgi:hypothetical protein